MKRRDFLKKTAGLISASILLNTSCKQVVQNGKRPNVIIIYADDLGYEDISIHGCKDFTTPNIDKLANESVRFTSGYVTAPACGPSRASLLTGRYQGRFGYDDNRCIRDGIPANQVLLPEVLQSAGYITGHIGKWHVGTKEGQKPLDRGFDESYAFRGLDASGRGDIRKRPDWYAEKACDFIEAHKDRNFFLYLAPLEVHTPLAASDERLERVSNISEKWRRLYAAMIQGLDDMVGKVMETVSQAGLDENTLIFFINDNGGSIAHPVYIYDGSIMPEPYVYDGGKRIVFEPRVRSNDPLNGGKGGLREGGIRVPYFVRWKNTLPSGMLYDRPVTAMDVFPTVASLAKAKVPHRHKLDGVSLIPYLKGDKQHVPHEFICWRKELHNGEWWKVIRKGDWKLSMQGSTISLFNLADDIGEKSNLADKHPDTVNELKSILEKWNREVSAEVRASGFKALSKGQWVLEDKKARQKEKSEDGQ